MPRAVTAVDGTAVVLPVGVLVGGGLLVLAGTILEGVLPWPALVLTALGCGASIPAALWTVFVPMLLVAFFVRARLAAAGDDAPVRVGHTGASRRMTWGRSGAVGARQRVRRARGGVSVARTSNGWGAPGRVSGTRRP